MFDFLSKHETCRVLSTLLNNHSELSRSVLHGSILDYQNKLMAVEIDTWRQSKTKKLLETFAMLILEEGGPQWLRLKPSGVKLSDNLSALLEYMILHDALITQDFNIQAVTNNYLNIINALNLMRIIENSLNDLSDIYQSIVKEQITEDEARELIKIMFNEALMDYENFVDQNKNDLEKMERIANDGFRINVLEKVCTMFRLKKYCSFRKQPKAIKSLSEITPYLEQLTKEEASEKIEL